MTPLPGSVADCICGSRASQHYPSCPFSREAEQRARLWEVVDFLHSRIAEDEESARAWAARNGMRGYSSPACQTKRRMIADVLALPRPETEEWVLHMLANDYRGHPGWRTDWNGWLR